MRGGLDIRVEVACWAREMTAPWPPWQNKAITGKRMKRRDFLAGAAALPIAFSTSRGFADDYPSRNLTIIVPFPPGGQADLAARPVAQKLQELFGKPVIVDNRGGAGGAIGNALAARAEPDGYTLLMTLSSLA